MIEPTIGRVLWYHPNPAAGDTAAINPEQPYVALVTAVYNARLVNLIVWNHAGFMFAKDHVKLAQDDDQIEGGHAQWMPYQVGQAKKHDAEVYAPPKDPLGELKASLDRAHERIEELEKRPEEKTEDLSVDELSEKQENLADKQKTHSNFIEDLMKRMQGVEETVKGMSTPASDRPKSDPPGPIADKPPERPAPSAAQISRTFSPKPPAAKPQADQDDKAPQNDD